MKLFLQALAMALVLGAPGTASATHAPLHHRHGKADYNALSQGPRQPAPTGEYRGFSDDDSDGSLSTRTGGPVGGLGS